MSRSKNPFAVRKLTAMAMLIALQIVLSRLVGIQISEGLRISFESVPIILGGIWLGPVAGALIGLISDFLGTVISGYGFYFLPLAVTPVLNGILPGLIFRFVWKNNINVWKCIFTVFAVEIFASLICGTYALTWYYKLFVTNKETTFVLLFATRLPKLITMAVDALIVNVLHFSMYRRVIQPMFTERR
jgi:riboflavin transporter